MIEKLIGTLFLAREYAHRAHLSTKSFAQHEALGEFYTEIIEIADSLTEAYQGRHKIIEIEYLPMIDEEDPVKGLKILLDYVEDIRYDAIEKKDSALQNIVDEAVAQFLSTLYKLRNLK